MISGLGIYYCSSWCNLAAQAEQFLQVLPVHLFGRLDLVVWRLPCDSPLSRLWFFSSLASNGWRLTLRCLPIAQPPCARHTQVLEAPVVCARWLPWLRASGFFPLIVGFNLQICRLPPFMLQFHKKISIHYNIKNNHRTWKQLIYSHLRLVSSCLVSQVFQQWRWKIPSQHTGVISQLRHLVWNNKNILTGCSLQRSCAISAR